MKVLHIAESFAGGVFTSVSQLCNLQAIDCNEVYLAYSLRPGTPRDFKRYLDPRIKTIKINLTRNITPYSDLRGLFEIQKIIREISPAIIHLHSSKAGFIGRLAARLVCRKKIKVYYSPRGFAFLQLNLSYFKRQLYYLLEKLGTFFGGTIIACSQGEAREAKKLQTSNVVVIENAVDTGIIPVKKVNASCNIVKIGTLGRLCPQKNPLLFKQLATTFTSRDDLQFLWVGGGEDEYKLHEHVNIQVTGWLPRESALAHLADLDIYVQTSLWEGMPLAVIEAMVSGIPAVVTNVVGNQDIILHGETGFIADSSAEMVHFIDILSKDRNLRLEMGQKARQAALERFNLERLNREMVQLYLDS